MLSNIFQIFQILLHISNWLCHHFTKEKKWKYDNFSYRSLDFEVLLWAIIFEIQVILAWNIWNTWKIWNLVKNTFKYTQIYVKYEMKYFPFFGIFLNIIWQFNVYALEMSNGSRFVLFTYYVYYTCPFKKNVYCIASPWDSKRGRERHREERTHFSSCNIYQFQWNISHIPSKMVADVFFLWHFLCILVEFELSIEW